MVIILFLLLGLVVGSFLNVVIIRHKEKGIGGRSGCMSCREQLAAQDLIPVFSWVYLRGRCRQCGSRVSVQYPLVEASVAILFAGMIYGLMLSPTFDPSSIYSLVTLGIGLVIICLLVMITTYDIRHTIIPDSWSYGFAIAALFWTLSVYGFTLTVLYWAVVAALVCALPFAALWLVSGGRWMGLGDAKLALGIGALLGITDGFTSLLIAFWGGAGVSIVFLILLPRLVKMLGLKKFLRLRNFSLKSEVAFGPFLVFGCILVWYMNLYGLPLHILNFV
ncbi:MAG: prepilin peptidase leader peptidase (prepilin peptidase) / N-methyltransferase [Candidatus Kaiserbacteria bacterium]|nr:prepilin peptidase leader peptidase (prepilin peptidase) / N-methyltransferase [Candidatus Kaiserbacteria bacterium]